MKSLNARIQERKEIMIYIPPKGGESFSHAPEEAQAVLGFNKSIRG
jgi:hypothetical protein